MSNYACVRIPHGSVKLNYHTCKYGNNKASEPTSVSMEDGGIWPWSRGRWACIGNPGTS